jgi:hypothetical protein
MSDQPTGPAYPPPPSMPPPPPNVPPPAYQSPGYPSPPPAYQGQAYPPPPQSTYQASQPGYAYPGQMPPPINPTAAALGTSGTLLNQFGGYAAWSVGIGLVAIVLPLATNWYLPVAPIIGGLNGIRAIQRGRLIGGLVGIAINIVGGLVSLMASGILGGGS